ncbi:CARF [Bugula neritina]|uniref:CARF n=1 Tax=Bugula neritina TaxID=10212 RepID=A0A7J7JHV9_BUGNE|nr:CARF [Bugula neritina]
MIRVAVMECQYGPRRKGSKADGTREETGEGYWGYKILTNHTNIIILITDYKHACPARIYVKKVRKFPNCSVPTDVNRKVLKQLMDRAFQVLTEQGFSEGGEEQTYPKHLCTVGIICSYINYCGTRVSHCRHYLN